jgi:methionyl-tRNA formyltransferase
MQPEDPNSPAFLNELTELEPEAFVVAAYAHKLGADLLGLPVFGCINIHPSLLPLYRGAAPVNWAIIRGEKRTGITIMKMNERFDAGEILMQQGVDIGEDETAGELSRRLSTLGSDLLLKTLKGIELGTIEPRVQDESRATRAPRIGKSDCRVDWSESALEIKNLVRGLNPRPGAFSHFRGKVIKLLRTEVLSREGRDEPGKIVGLESGIMVMTGDGVLGLISLQPEGKREMSWSDFKNGFRPELGEEFGGSSSDAV